MRTLFLTAAFLLTSVHVQAQVTQSGTGSFANPHVYQYINGDQGWRSERGQSAAEVTTIEDENGNVLNTENWGVDQIANYSYTPQQKK